MCSFDDGNSSVLGKFAENECEIINGIKLDPQSNKEKAKVFPFLNQFGSIFSYYEDICVDEDCLHVAALLRKKGAGLDNNLNNFGMGLIMKLTPDNISYQPIFNIKVARTDSFTSFDYETPNGKAYFIVCMMEDGSL